MSLQSRNADVLTTAIIEGLMPHDQYIALSIRSGTTEEQAKKNLTAILTDHEESQVKDRLAECRENILSMFAELGASIAPTLPSEIQAVKIAVQIDSSGAIVDKFQVMKTDNIRFISMTEVQTNDPAAVSETGEPVAAE